MAIVIVILVLLCIEQLPMDIHRRVLSRRASLLATAGLLGLSLWELLVIDEYRRVLDGLASTAFVWCGYYLLHRLAPHALGFGDVLLTIPLSLAVAHVGFQRVLLWQLLASSSGAIHAVWVRLSRRQTTIPFGPHLMLSALVVLMASL